MDISLTYCSCENDIKKEVLQLVNKTSEIYKEDLITIKELKLFLFNDEDIDTKKADKIIIREINTIQGKAYKTSVKFDIWVIYSNDDVKGLAINVDEFKNLSMEIRIYLLHHEMTHLILNHGNRGFYIPKCLPNLIGREGAIQVSNILKYLIHDYEVNSILVKQIPELVLDEFKRQIIQLKSINKIINKKTGLNKLFYVLRVIASIKSIIINIKNIDGKNIEEILSEFLENEIKFKQIVKKEVKSMPEIKDEWFKEDHYKSVEGLIELFCIYLNKGTRLN